MNGDVLIKERKGTIFGLLLFHPCRCLASLVAFQWGSLVEPLTILINFSLSCTYTNGTFQHPPLLFMNSSSMILINDI